MMSAFWIHNIKKTASTAFLPLSLVVLVGCATTVAYIPNPLATPEQLAAERLARQIVQDKAMKDAREYLYATWLENAGILDPGGAPASKEQLALLGNAVDEAVFGAALAAQTSDPNHPKLLITVAGPHTWFGTTVPGSRFAFDNPDTIYWQVSVDPGSKYIIHGRRNGQPPVTENLSLLDAVTQRTTANIAGPDLVTDPDGSFAVTLDRDPANGRSNHLQVTAPSLVLVRNTANDWANQTFDTLSIERLEGPVPPPPPRTYQELVNATAALVRSRWAVVEQYGQYASAPPVNTLPALGAANPAFSVQAGSFSSWRLADDEALVLRVNLGGARYFSCSVYTKWLTTTDYVNHTQSLNNVQAKPNPEGTCTLVISVRDPGVYNWVDTVGMHEGTLDLRWQGLAATTPASGDISATMKHVKLTDLKSVLPKDTIFVSKGERLQQIKERAADFTRRYAERLKVIK